MKLSNIFASSNKTTANSRLACGSRSSKIKNSMASVLQLCRRLTTRPELFSITGITIRHYESESDIAAWLELRHQAFARQRIGVRQWSAADFHAEFTSRWWWSPQRMWLVESSSHGAIVGTPSARGQLVGTVALAIRGEENQTRASPTGRALADGASALATAGYRSAVNIALRSRRLGRWLSRDLAGNACRLGGRREVLSIARLSKVIRHQPVPANRSTSNSRHLITDR